MQSRRVSGSMSSNSCIRRAEAAMSTSSMASVSMVKNSATLLAARHRRTSGVIATGATGASASGNDSGNKRLNIRNRRSTDNIMVSLNGDKRNSSNLLMNAAAAEPNVAGHRSDAQKRPLQIHTKAL